MKHLKTYENSEIQYLTINLSDLCDWLGDMYNAVEMLMILQKNSTSYCVDFLGEIYCNEKIEHYFDKGLNKYHKTKNDKKGIKIINMAVTYGFMKRRKYKIIFSFKNVRHFNGLDEIEIKINTQKYNL